MPYDVEGVLLARPFKIRRLGHSASTCMTWKPV
jgi:hypothetical protein